MVTKTANNNLNATVSYKDSNLIIFSNFPSLSLSLNHVAVTNKAPFLGDTLYSAEHLYLNMGLFELFKTNEPIKINSIKSENGFVNILINEDNIGNYDIAIKKKQTQIQLLIILFHLILMLMNCLICIFVM